MKTLHCQDAGFDCEAVMQAETEEQVLQKAAEHALAVHGVNEISREAVEKIRALIREE